MRPRDTAPERPPTAMGDRKTITKVDRPDRDHSLGTMMFSMQRTFADVLPYAPRYASDA